MNTIDLDTFIENKNPIHTRDIRMATYPYSKNQVVVHGTLKDEGHIRIFDITGEVKDPRIIHHMDVKLLIASKPLRIEAAQAKMLTVPIEECHQTLDTIKQLEGLEIKSGFSGKLRKIMGGKKGCTHLCHLITVMGQAIVHGWMMHHRSKESPVPKSLDELTDKGFLLDSCRMWTRQGPKFKSLEQAILKANPS